MCIAGMGSYSQIYRPTPQACFLHSEQYFVMQVFGYSVRGLALLMLVALANGANAQVSMKALPYSIQNGSHIYTPTRHLSAAQFEEQESSSDINTDFFSPWFMVEQGFTESKPRRHGVEREADLGFDNAGYWTTLPNGDRLWTLRIQAEGASSINLIYDDFFLPEGAQLFLYNDDRSRVIGAFTARNNSEHGFATDILPGDATTLEYYEPARTMYPGRLHISTIVQGLPSSRADVDRGDIRKGQFASTSSSPYVPTSLPCSINAACYNNDWNDEINSVVKIVLGGETCTGVLLNNTNEDERPYVLTANHCGSPSVGDVVNWVFEFNYQSNACADPQNDPVPQSISGATVRAAAGGSFDFTLLELSEPIPAEYNVHFAGWSVDGATPSSAAVIGHPEGDIKKITLDNDPLTTYATIYWQSTLDHGTIEGGSSGSPLFSDDGKVIGVLKAARALDFNTCSGPGGDDNAPKIIFPKLSMIWGLGLSDYLDPSGGTMSMGPLVGSGGNAASLWINEVDAHALGSETQEFIEIVGSPGADLSGYSIDVYSCSGGTSTLQSTETIGNFTIPNDEGDYGFFIMGGPGVSASVADDNFSSANSLPNGRGIIVLKDDTGAEVFDYQYDTLVVGLPEHCPATRTTRSAGDAQGIGSMGFTISGGPSAIQTAVSNLTASPGIANFDGGQDLPVELVSFEALRDGDTVELRWETASELNNAGFEVEHKTVSTLDDPWEVYGFVEGFGTTEVTQHYTHRISFLSPGKHRFRLKQVDYDGTFEYSPEVEVSIDVPGTFVLSPAYPNPFNPETTFSLSIAQGQEVQVAVYDVVGRQVAVLHRGFIASESSRTFRFDGANLPSGMYLIRAVGEQFIASQSITLLK